MRLEDFGCQIDIQCGNHLEGWEATVSVLVDKSWLKTLKSSVENVWEFNRNSPYISSTGRISFYLNGISLIEVEIGFDQIYEEQDRDLVIMFFNPDYDLLKSFGLFEFTTDFKWNKDDWMDAVDMSDTNIALVKDFLHHCGFPLDYRSVISYNQLT